MPLTLAERPARGEPHGLLVLHHGRGSDEQDLIGLASVLDPEERLHVVAPRAPLRVPGSPGYHWYLVPRVGYPDPRSFQAAYGELATFHDGLWQRTGIDPSRTVLGGFSMGTVMSYALGLGHDRPAPAGILALSGFIPTVEGWQPSLDDRRDTRILVAHGQADAVIPVTFARQARELLEAAGLDIDYLESGAAHHVEPHGMARAADWLDDLLGKD